MAAEIFYAATWNIFCDIKNVCTNVIICNFLSYRGVSMELLLVLFPFRTFTPCCDRHQGKSPEMRNFVVSVYQEINLTQFAAIILDWFIVEVEKPQKE